jgi:RNA-directed DNA polymerase
MLTALEQGVKGGLWFSLMDKVYARRNLESSYRKVQTNQGAAGADHQSVKMYGEHLTENLERVQKALQDGTYRPQAVRRAYIPKPDGTQRPLGIPTVQDRVVQGALRHVLEPIFERDFAEQSYGFRPGRGCKDALRLVDRLLKAGYRYVVDVDLKSYFDTIPHEKLMDRIRGKVADGRVLALVEAFLKQGVLHELEQWTLEEGTPQGAVISPLLANIYLDPLDHHMAGRGYAMIRYADDFVVLCRSLDEAQRALDEIQQWTAQAGLTVHPTKTRIVDVTVDSFEFLGYHFERGKHWPRKSSLAKLKTNIRAKTKRANGDSLTDIVISLNLTLEGWFAYFQHSWKTTFPPLDGWVRMRLRSILRKRLGLVGCGRGADHQRWPNAYFASQGLFSLVQAHRLGCQSSTR